LGSTNPLQRERSRDGFPPSLNEMIQYQGKVAHELFDAAMQELMATIDIMSNAIRWEGKAGAITASTVILEKLNYKEFEDKILNLSIEFLFKNEFGCLQQILSYIQAYTKKHGQDFFLNIREKIYNQLNSLWVKYGSIMEEEAQADPNASVNPLLMKETFKTRSETNLAIDSLYKTLLSFIEAFAEKSKFIDTQLLELVCKTKNHSKQEIRGLGCEIIGATVAKLSDEVWNENIVPVGDFLIELMGDEYTTVRHQATVNVFKFANRAAINNSLQQFAPRLVPRILINRYHPAQSLSNDSMTLWKEYLEKIGMVGGGRDVLTKLTNEACEFYLNQLKYSHHEILKAALGALRELIMKVEGSQETIKTNFDELLEACFKITRHENPAIRSTCFITLGSLVSKCPEQAKPKIPQLIDVGMFQICFNFKSEEIAESVALYLVDVYQTFKDDVHLIYNQKVRDKLASSESPEETLQVEEEDEPIKYKNEIIRPKGYEVATGMLILLSELVRVDTEVLDQNMKGVISILSLRKTGFYESMILYAWRTIHGAIVAWDKKIVKTHLESIIEPLLRDLKCQKQNIRMEVTQIIRATAEKIGPNIFKARVENVFGDMYSKQIDEILSVPK